LQFATKVLFAQWHSISSLLIFCRKYAENINTLINIT